MLSRAVICLMCSVGVGSIAAQTNVSGQILDPDGAPVAGVAVTLSPGGGGVAADSTSTDQNGMFHLLKVPAGDYELDVPAQFGFQQYHAAMHVGRTPLVTLRVNLRPAPVTQDLTVEPQAGEVALDQDANRDQVRTDANLLEKVPVFDQNYIAALTPFLDQTGVGTNGVVVIVDGMEMKGTGVSASAIAEARITYSGLTRSVDESSSICNVLRDVRYRFRLHASDGGGCSGVAAGDAV